MLQNYGYLKQLDSPVFFNVFLFKICVKDGFWKHPEESSRCTMNRSHRFSTISLLPWRMSLSCSWTVCRKNEADISAITLFSVRDQSPVFPETQLPRGPSGTARASCKGECFQAHHRHPEHLLWHMLPLL